MTSEGNAMHIKPIRSDADHAAAVEEIDRLWNAEPGTPEHDTLEVLGILVDAYEEERWPLPPANPIGALKFRMEQAGYTQADLAELLGSRSRASEILSRRRYLTTEMIWKISREWGIPADWLVEPYELEERKSA